MFLFVSVAIVRFSQIKQGTNEWMSGWQLVGWLGVNWALDSTIVADWLTGWLADSLANGRLIGWLADWL